MSKRYGRKKPSKARWIVTLLLLAGVGVGAYHLYTRDNATEASDPNAPGETVGGTDEKIDGDIPPINPPGLVDADEGDESAPATRAATTTADAGGESKPTDELPPEPTKLSAAEARRAYDDGMKALREGTLVEARTRLNRAYYSGQLSAQRRAELRPTLEQLAEATLIGERTTVHEGDPYTYRYVLKPGEVLGRVERRERLHVPWQLLLRVNGVRSASNMRAGQTYKFVRGPFHAVIDKDAFRMDLFLQREDLPRVFIKRIPIGTGRGGATPEGAWRVRLGGKEMHPTWYPPPNSPLRGAIPYGHPDYAFGEKGLWISLEGLDENTRLLRDYGIHSTNDPNSIGTAASLGCIRLRDEDIELVYSLLYEHWSTVEVRP